MLAPHKDDHIWSQIYRLTFGEEERKRKKRSVGGGGGFAFPPPPLANLLCELIQGDARHMAVHPLLGEGEGGEAKVGQSQPNASVGRNAGIKERSPVWRHVS